MTHQNGKMTNCKRATIQHRKNLRRPRKLGSRGLIQELTPKFLRHTLSLMFGLVIFLLTMAQAINGILRPHALGHRQLGEKESKAGVEIHDIQGTVEAVERKQEDSGEEPMDHTEQAPLDKGLARTGWEIFHRLLGFTLLDFTWWQVQDGLGLFAERFSEDNLDTLFWIVVSCIAGSIAILALFSRFAV